MVALVVVSIFVVALLGILVAGLLRSHADILRSLHELGVGVGDPAAPPVSGATGAGSPAPVHLATPSSGPPLGPAPAVAGVTPAGDARAVAVDNSDHLTLLGFLSSGCATCGAFWHALQEPEHLGLPDHTRIVIVTKGPDREVMAEVRARDGGRVPVVMSTEAWLDYQVPGSPFFVLVDGATGQKVGQGVASHVGQLAELVRRAEHDRGGHDRGRYDRGGHDRGSPPGGSNGGAGPAALGSGLQTGLNGPAREAVADEVLRAAGILPGDPSLYPRTLEDVFPFSHSAANRAGSGGVTAAQS